MIECERERFGKIVHKQHILKILRGQVVSKNPSVLFRIIEHVVEHGHDLFSDIGFVHRDQTFDEDHSFSRTLWLELHVMAILIQLIESNDDASNVALVMEHIEARELRHRLHQRCERHRAIVRILLRDHASMHCGQSAGVMEKHVALEIRGCHPKVVRIVEHEAVDWNLDAVEMAKSLCTVPNHGMGRIFLSSVAGRGYHGSQCPRSFDGLDCHRCVLNVVKRTPQRPCHVQRI